MSEQKELDVCLKKEQSKYMGTKGEQSCIVESVNMIIRDFYNAHLVTVKDDSTLDFSLFIQENQLSIIKELTNNGLWPALSRAWNSCGMPVFDGYEPYSKVPKFLHFDCYGNDVSELANLNCQSPYCFYHFEEKEYNESVIEYWIQSLKQLQIDYNFDGFRLDHVDHIVDIYSQYADIPITYRVPSQVLRRMNRELKNHLLYFGTIAEYML